MVLWPCGLLCSDCSLILFLLCDWEMDEDKDRDMDRDKDEDRG